MKVKSTANSNKDSQKLILEIRNKLRTLGLKPSIKGTILINKAIRIILETVDYEDYFMANEIYKKVAEYYNISFVQVKAYIQYALDNRNIQKSKDNFKNIFGFEYDTYYFTSKIFLEEITKII